MVGRGKRASDTVEGRSGTGGSRTSQEWSVCRHDCGANSAKRTTTRSWLASSTSNLALFKNEDGAALKADKSLIGRSRDRPYFGATAAGARFYRGPRRPATRRRAFARNALAPGINKIKTRGGRGVREFVARARRPVRGYVARFK